MPSPAGATDHGVDGRRDRRRSASLFDGMVLFSPSDVSQSPPSSPPPPPLPEVETTASVTAAAAESAPTSQPLDEDLFSDLTLEIPSPSSAPALAPARQISRKKKRAVRIGYGRDDSDPGPVPAPVTSDSQSTVGQHAAEQQYGESFQRFTGAAGPPPQIQGIRGAPSAQAPRGSLR